MITRARTLVAVVVALLVLAIVAIPIGRHEGSTAVRVQQQKIEATLALTPAGISWKGLAAYRFASNYVCLLYRAGKNPFALEFCFDYQGRLVESIDRRNATSPHFGSLRYEPSAAPVRIAPAKLAVFFHGIVPLEPLHLKPDQLPLGIADGGPALYAAQCPSCPATG
jgi:hypothetical protein